VRFAGDTDTEGLCGLLADMVIRRRGGRYYYDKIARGYQEGALGGGVGFDDSGAVARGHMHWDNQRESDGDNDNARH
jgi:hypothetical protein